MRTYVRYCAWDDRPHAMSVSARPWWTRCGRSASSRRSSTSGSPRSRARADDRGYWKAAGCSSLAQWLAQITSSDYRTARRLTETAEALRELPALDQAFRDGDLTLDQVAAAAPFATPASDAEIARVAVGKAPSQISLAARAIVPPKVADDQALYKRRALRMTWSAEARARLQRTAAARARRRVRAGHPRPRQDPTRRRQAARHDPRVAAIRRRRARHARPPGRRRRRWRAAQPDDADRAPQRRRAADARRRRADQPRDRRAAHLRRAPAHASSSRVATSCTRASDAAPPTPSCARSTSAQAATASTPAAPPPANSKHTTSLPSNTAAQPTSPTSSCSAPATTNSSTTTTSTPAAPADRPIFTDQSGRTITTNQPHAPPA